ncbi:hypothetical protein HMN09_01230100 [Mycena chlorophos]|uniref:Uncharacterized protein n=1 Tax=Mycena chlorophos TaxID=658473 RepID=A0A8H6S3D5_MYCCL|nr:hypothetical protein HMN09_01230100 [Mycena chlorophos]
MSASSPPAPTLPVVECTNYARFVVAAVKAATTGLKLNQEVLRTALSLCSSYLVTDTSTNDDPTSGSQSWFTGLNQLVDLLVALHARDELEIDTLNAASMACSESWSVVNSWGALEECREGVRKAGTKLRRLLDEEGFTYRGQNVYSPLAPVRPPPPIPAPATSTNNA